MPRRPPFVVLLAVLAAVYFAAAKLGLSVAFLASQVSTVWPPTAIGLVALLMLGRRLWPALWVGALAVNLGAQTPFPVAVGIATGNTLEALAGVWLLKRWGFDPALERIRDVVGLLLAAGASSVVSATVGVTSLCAGYVQPWQAYGALWLTWCLGDAMSDVLFAPLLMTWGAALRNMRFSGRLGESLLLLSLLAAVCQAVFGERFASVAVHYSLAYLVFPFLLAVSVRLDQRMTSLAVVLTALIAIRGTLHGYGPFAAGSAHENITLLQAFLAVLAVTGLILGAAMAERKTEGRRRAADYAVTLALAQSPSLDEGSRRILQAIGENLEWDVGVLWTVDPRAGALRCVDLWHGAEAPRFAEVSRQLTFQPGVGLPGQVWATGRPSWVPDVARAGNSPRAPGAAAEGLHGAFGFPILLYHEVLGVMEFVSREIRKPDEQLLRMFATIGAQVGQFIDRRRAEEERLTLLARERAARQEAEATLQQLREAETELRRSAEAKDQFLAVLGHELRNPLAPLRNALEILRAHCATDTVVQGALDMMQRQLGHLVRLVDDLLDVARITRGKIELRRQPVEMSELAVRAVESLRPLLEARDTRVLLDFTSERLPLEVDPTRIEQVIWNLLSNATKYSEPGRRVWLETAREGARGVLRVRDEGIGIEPEMLDNVFDLFVQADRVRGRVQEGLGLGLTLVRSLVEQHGGTVTAKSEGRGKGSEFTVTLPLAPAAAAVAAPRRPSEPAPSPASPAGAAVLPRSGPSRRVLVVDDNVDGAESLAFLLQQSGHEVRMVHDGPSALRIAREYQPEVVLLDIGLPAGMDGYEVARLLRQEVGLDKAVLYALTGFGQAEDRRRAEEAGFDRHLVKPVEPARLQQLLAEFK